MKKLLIAGALCFSTSLFLTSCGGGDGEGNDHATQDETSIETEETENTGTMQDDISEDTTMMGDTATTDTTM